MLFPSEDFPPLGSAKVPAKDSRDVVPVKDSGDVVPVKDSGDVVPVKDSGDVVPEHCRIETHECFVCGCRGGADVVGWGDWSVGNLRILFGKGVCNECLKGTPQSFILQNYLRTGESVSKKHISAICEWVLLWPDMWPGDYPVDIIERDVRNERWESLHYYSVWVKEERFKGERVAWFSGTHRKMVKGVIHGVRDDRCLVYRESETAEEKALGKFCQKEIGARKLFPHLSQKESLQMIRETPGFTRPKKKAPFKCCGPCDRVRISECAAEHLSGPHKSPSTDGLYCKDCVVKSNIVEKDDNLWMARRHYSDRDHRGFGGCWVGTGKYNLVGEEITRFRTCSCPDCGYDSRQMEMTHVCGGCGINGVGPSGWFDRSSPAGGGKCEWENEDHWFCKECWMKDYWKTGEWEWQGDGSVQFKSS